MHELIWLHLKKVGVLINKSLNVDEIQMCLCAIACLTCMQNVGTLRMLGECSRRCHLEMWSLGPPSY
jgi:hypothetical protein